MKERRAIARMNYASFISTRVFYISHVKRKVADTRRQKEYSTLEDIFYSIIQTPNAIRTPTLSLLTPLTLHLINFKLPGVTSRGFPMLFPLKKQAKMSKGAVHLAQCWDLAAAKKHKAGEISQRLSD